MALGEADRGQVGDTCPDRTLGSAFNLNVFSL